jgi:hypothetical protein
MMKFFVRGGEIVPIIRNTDRAVAVIANVVSA